LVIEPAVGICMGSEPVLNLVNQLVNQSSCFWCCGTCDQHLWATWQCTILPMNKLWASGLGNIYLLMNFW